MGERKISLVNNNVLLTKHDVEYWMLAKFLFCAFMDQDEIEVNNTAKEGGQYQAILRVYRVQRKSFLQLDIWASWSQHSLTQKSFQLAPNTFWRAELISQFFCYLNSSKNITYPSGNLKTEFTSPIAKSTSSGLLTLLSLHAGTSVVNIGFVIWP